MGRSTNPFNHFADILPSVSIAKRLRVAARKEVILSAGSISSPQILMLSGIGPKSSLQAVGVQQLVNLPDVGQHLTDHPLLASYWSVNSNNTFDDMLRNTTLLNAEMVQWEQSKTGLFSASPVNSIGFLRIPSSDSIFKQASDPSAGT